MRIFLVRHGQTQHNVERRIQGPLLDDPLNAHGQEQAARLEQRFAQERANGLDLAAVYSSPMKRAWMTAEALARGAGTHEVHRLDGMIEYSWGIYLGRQESDGVYEAMKHAHDEWESGNLDHAPTEGESPNDAWQRVQAALAPLFARHADDDIAIVAHGRINKVLLAGLLAGDLRKMDDYPQGNTAVTLIETDDSHPTARAPAPDPADGEPTPLPPWNWRMVHVNDQAHLLGLEAPQDIPSEGPDSPLV